MRKGAATRRRSLAALACALVLAASAWGCSKKIGDDCTYNTDCNPQGGRVCDVSQPSGYCTIEGCDVFNNKCPDEATCIRFFPTLDMTRPCAPEHEIACSDRTPGCDPAQDPACCHCAADEECITEGFCIRRELERRTCMFNCQSDGDCRGGYRCYASGTGGAELIPLDDGGSRGTAHFCAPAP
ncbi:MAG TPA: hypothetical protein VGQ83_20945 [Polyangia bacterium]|jgi:hypothetical protein